ncbi:MFS multidrug transporter [Apiospora rasikravindrae]|uniref:MFS multidrug transporter n=1 Tax=Apiospora rasikravindrae TaxID=990691 RepID=A0ABR1RP83_9PEZI
MAISISATANAPSPQASGTTKTDESADGRVNAPSLPGELKSDGPETPSLGPKETSPDAAVVVTWDGPDDPQDPFNWLPWKKWWAVGLGLIASLVCSMNGSILAVAHAAISEEFSIPDGPFPHSYWITTSWGIGAALFPLLLFPAMEDWGVRPVLLGTYFCFVCLLVPVGFSHNFATLVAVRFLSGGCVPLMSDAVASIASNVFHGEQARSVPIALYVLVYLGATSLGPVIGAAVLRHLSWRWIGHIELIMTGALFPVLFMGLPESRGAAILRAKAKRLRGEGKVAFTAEEVDPTPLGQRIMKSLTRPLYMFFTEGVVFVAALWAAFSLGTIYLFTHSVDQVYGELYGWSPVQSGYVQSAIVVGEVLGTILSLSTNHWYEASAARNTEVPGTPIPEARLYAAIIGGFTGVTGGMFIYAWAAYTTVHWMVITVGLTMVGLGTTAVVISIANYLIDAYSKYAASALAAVGLAENLSIAFLPLASSALYTGLGFQWASTLLGLVSLVLVATPFVVIRWGKEIRGRSPFMKEAIIDRRMNSGLALNV